MIDIDTASANQEEIENNCNYGSFDNNGTVQEIASYIYKYKFWIKFSSIFSIILGIILCLSIVGIVIGWLPIWLGMILRSSINSFEKAYVEGETLELECGIIEINRYFKINGILHLFFLLIWFVFIIVRIVS